MFFPSTLFPIVNGPTIGDLTGGKKPG